MQSVLSAVGKEQRSSSDSVPDSGPLKEIVMAFEGILATVVIGLIIGFIADRIMGSGGIGLLWSIVLGLVGSVVGGFLFSLIGIAGYGILGQILVGIVGACIVLFGAEKLKRA